MTGGKELHWKEIVDRHGKRVFRIAMRILGSIHDAEDVSQEVLVEAYRLQQRHPVQSWDGLLVRLATTRSIDRLRRLRPESALCDHDSVTTIEPFEEATARELAQLLRSTIARLPDQQATVFTLVHFEQLSRDEVAESLNISPEGVSSSLYKARQRLRSKLSMFHYGESK